MRKLFIILLCLSMLAALCACDIIPDVSGDTSLPNAESSQPAESSAPPAESSAPPVVSEIVDTFYELQPYTDYYDVVKRVYTDSRKVAYTDYHGLATADKVICCLCRYQDYFEPIRIDGIVVPNRFITKNGSEAVLVDSNGVILNTVELSAIDFPEKISPAISISAQSVVGNAGLVSGGVALINANGELLTEAFESSVLNEMSYYLCKRGSAEFKYTPAGELIASVDSSPKEYGKINDTYAIMVASTWEKTEYSVVDAEGKTIIGGLSGTDISFADKFGWFVASVGSVKRIYSTAGVLLAECSSFELFEESTEYAVITREGMVIDTVIAEDGTVSRTVAKKTLCSLMTPTGAIPFAETFRTCRFLDAQTLQVTLDDGTVTEVFIAQLTPAAIPAAYSTLLASLGTQLADNIGYSLFDVNGDGIDELVVTLLGNGYQRRMIYSASGALMLDVSGSDFRIDGIGRLVVNTGKNSDNYRTYEFQNGKFALENSVIGRTTHFSGSGNIFYEINGVISDFSEITAFYGEVWNTVYRADGASGRMIDLNATSIPEGDYNSKKQLLLANTFELEPILTVYIR